MPKVKDLAASSRKWAERTGAATAEYEAGVNNPKQDWAQATQAGEANYKAGVTKAANEGRFGKGVAKAGSDGWKRGVTQKGAQRFAAGAAVAQPDYAAGFAPFAQVIEAVQLPPRKPKGDPSNINRVSAIATALSAAKRGGR